jgi:hypothetical protein
MRPIITHGHLGPSPILDEWDRFGGLQVLDP